MKKRILSFAMALCMVLLALPFAALPTIAAEKESFTTTFSPSEETWPSYESGESFKRFNGNWTIGYFDDGVYRDHNSFAKKNNIITTGGDPWVNTGVYLDSSATIILTQGGLSGDGAAFYSPSSFKEEMIIQ